MVAGGTNSLPIQVHTNKEYHFWLNLHERSLIFYMLHHFITQGLKNILLYSIEIVIDQYFQLILQCYFNGHAVATLVVAGAFLITCFLGRCHLLGTSSPNYLGCLLFSMIWQYKHDLK